MQTQHRIQTRRVFILSIKLYIQYQPNPIRIFDIEEKNTPVFTNATVMLACGVF
jgi:hypothetical protein